MAKRTHIVLLLLLTVLLAAQGCGYEERIDPTDINQAHLAATRLCPASTGFLEGIDVSKYQGAINWAQVKSAGIGFAIARASHGTKAVDPQFTANWQGMKQAGVIRGVYQYFDPDVDPVTQADFMLDAITQAGGLQPDDLPPVLDLEAEPSIPPAQYQQKALAWLQHVQQRTGKRPIVYTAAYFAEKNLASALAAYPLWIANWTDKAPAQGGCPLMPDSGGWSEWKIWQYSNSGTVAGIDGAVDRDLFVGDATALRAFITAQTTGQGNTTPTTGARGALETVSCARVAGWAFTTAGQATPVELYVDQAPGVGQPYATLSAQVKRDDLCAQLGGSCYHGFEWQIPSLLQDGASHTLYAAILDPATGTRINLPGSGQSLSCSNGQPTQPQPTQPQPTTEQPYPAGAQPQDGCSLAGSTSAGATPALLALGLLCVLARRRQPPKLR